ncbi:thiamine diphosphokinase [Desulfotomaculum arcticum]|uniref:Thiamine diphosphokinase n=1 Tax=Desulfotruncus arcticus DSM 17038 TaxID=1121424 RepID=A0A1I2QAD2_9FIRM|nr:thiamine diphosphokinase [Desulfotruncus arcticus]SFG24880.1 thiamine diphosphokinase [Desulfotomaculum arcticum] [Desulfotruncus arcticus DSM 17038]
MRCVVVTGGSAGEASWLAEMIKPEDRVICVDGGARYIDSLGIVPDMIIGDMDSIDRGLLDKFKKLGSVIKEHPAEKDDTDTALAVAEALAGKPGEIIILGALGTRFDHSLANIHLLAVAREQGVRARIVNEFNDISLVSPGERTVVEGAAGELFSLLPLTAKVTGINVTGAKWPLRDAEFVIGNPYGISNRLAADRAEITIDSGLLLLIKINQRGELHGSN